MHGDITKWSRACHARLANKVGCHHCSPILHIPIPTEAFTHIHFDLVGPLPPSTGFNYLFTIIDRYSQWLEVIPLRSTSGDDCAQALVLYWVAWFCIPRHLTSAPSLPLPSGLHSPTPSVWTSITQALWARLNLPSWIQQLPWILLVSGRVRHDFQCSSADLIFRFSPLLPRELFRCLQPWLPSTTPHSTTGLPRHLLHPGKDALRTVEFAYHCIDANRNALPTTEKPSTSTSPALPSG